MASIELGGTVKALKLERAKSTERTFEVGQGDQCSGGALRDKHGDIEWEWT